jgi:uncharacterized small protein (DUF1192 family)
MNNENETNWSNDNHIGIVMGGYIDSNHKLMDRTELNRRISAIKKEIEKRDKLLQQANRYMKEMKLKHYPNTTNSFVDEWFKDYEELLK